MKLMLLLLVLLTEPFVADERPFSLANEPQPCSGFDRRGFNLSEPEAPARNDEARGLAGASGSLTDNSKSVKRLPPLPGPLPRGGGEGTNPETRRTQWVMFTAEWCPACRAARADFEPWLARSGWRIDDTPQAHIRLIDGDAHPDLLASMGIEMYPTFVLMRDGVELFRQQGYPGRAELVRRYLEGARSASEDGAVSVPRSRFGLPDTNASSESSPGPNPTAAINVGTLTGQRGNIAALIETLRPLLGDGGTLTMQLDRRGDSSAVIPLGERTSVAVGNPLVMRYSLESDVLICRFDEPLPRGRFSWGFSLEQPLTAVSASVAQVVVEFPRAPDLTWRVAP